MDDDLPDCPNCGQKMRLAASLPAENDLPGVQGFRCDHCGGELTREVE
jgi:hypothetical protein